MTDYNDGKWHGWNGGECPVHPETIIDYVWLCQGVKNTFLAINQHAFETLFEGNDYGKLVVFRVVKEYKEPKEIYSACGLYFPTKELAKVYADKSTWPTTLDTTVRKYREVPG